MKRLCYGLALTAVVVVGLGFYQGWFGFGAGSADGKPNVTLSMDTAKIQADGKAAVKNVKEAGRQLQDKIAGAAATTMEGKVVKVAADRLTMTDAAGKEHEHALAASVETTCDGKKCAATELKPGMKIRATMAGTAPHGVTRIEALDKEVAFADGVHDGAVVSITDDRLTMTNVGSKDEHSHGLTAATRVTRDGKECKAADLKPGMRIRVTTESVEPRAVTRIEAIEKDASFAKAGG